MCTDDEPAVDAPERLLKLAQDFWGCGPLHVPAEILHGPNVLEALVHLADIRLHLVAPVRPQDNKSRFHPPVAHSGQRSSPHLEGQSAVVGMKVDCKQKGKCW